jgi:hypothetical protein
MAEISLTAYSDSAAYAVLSRLDPADLAESEAMRGKPSSGLELFADWRALQGHCLASMVVRSGLGLTGTPIALFALVGTGQAGIAMAGLLACSHRTWRPELLRLAVEIRRAMPGFAAVRGIHRIEARCWARHPSAYTLLQALGFRHEAHLYGFGPKGTETFHQFAFLPPTQP